MDKRTIISIAKEINNIMLQEEKYIAYDFKDNMINPNYFITVMNTEKGVILIKANAETEQQINSIIKFFIKQYG